jgi:CheY-like chemotaxis protein
MPKHVLVIDDQDEARGLVAYALGAEGYRVSEAEDAQAALHLLGEEVPDLILSDIMMPGLDGFGLVERIRSDRRLLGVPVIFMTAATNTEIEDRARAQGVEHFVRKPYKIKQVLAMVRGTLERFSQLREAGVLRPTVAPVGTGEGDQDLVLTGIPPLDDLSGGLPRNRAYYVTGDVGTGKGVLGVQFLQHALAAGEPALMVTTDRPSAVIRLADGVGLSLMPHLRSGRLCLLELQPDFDRLVESPDDLRLLVREIARHASEMQAARLTVYSVLTILCGSARLSLTAATVSGFLRTVEDTGVTAMLVGDHPATAEEQLADAFLRRAAFGSFRLASDEARSDLRVLTAERLLSATVDAAGRTYRIARGAGLVSADADSVDVPSRAELQSRIGDALVRARAIGKGPLVVDRSGGVRVRDAWALTFRDCAREALRAQERCAILVAELTGSESEARARVEASLRPLWDDENRLPCWVGDRELVVVGLGADRPSMEALAAGISERLRELGDGADAGSIALRCAVSSYPNDGKENATPAEAALAPEAAPEVVRPRRRK